ncbi:ABC transporter permease [Frigidibacter sp. MR17.24]|uniref:ABC transporter permease n=1 Tax=Frigidibacter sp. MR17.24 TaxID=3127345 RepID=UPI003012E8F0
MLADLWYDLPPLAQDLAVTLAWLVPPAVLAAIVLRGFAPGPLVRALLGRFRGANAIFVALIAISVAMGIGLTAQERGLRRGMATAADKFDLVVSAPGSEMTMLLATVFLQPSDVALLDGAAFDRIARAEGVGIAAPLAYGDSHGTAPVVGTIAAFVTHLSGGRIEGRLWRTSHEAVVGAAVPLAIGDRFTPAHGQGEAADHDAHDEDHLTVTGRMAATGTPWDRAILVPVETVWEVHGLANGHRPDEGDRLGPPFDPARFPGTPAVVVQASGLAAAYRLRAEFARGEGTMAFFPGTVLSELYRVMGDVRQAMSLMAAVSQALVAAAVLLGLGILTRLFARQAAMLRALGAPRRFVVAVIWSYGAVLLAAGTVLGLGLGRGAAAVLSRIVTARTDVLVEAGLGWPEVQLAAAFLSVTLLASLVPALAILRQPVAAGLRA